MPTAPSLRGGHAREEPANVVVMSARRIHTHRLSVARERVPDLRLGKQVHTPDDVAYTAAAIVSVAAKAAASAVPRLMMRIRAACARRSLAQPPPTQLRSLLAHAHAPLHHLRVSDATVLLACSLFPARAGTGAAAAGGAQCARRERSSSWLASRECRRRQR